MTFSPININEERFRSALRTELPGLAFMLDGSQDMLDLRFTFRVSSGFEMFVNEQAGHEQVRILAERLRQDVLVKTGASRIVQAANDQAEQYRLENVRLSRSLQDREQEVRDLKARIVDMQDQIGEQL